MKFTRGKRIAFELLGPPAIGAGIFSLCYIGMGAWGIVVKGVALEKTLNDVIPATLLFLIFAYVFAGTQSIVYTVVMEWRFKRGLDPCSWTMVGLSSALGLVSGAGMLFIVGKTWYWKAGDSIFWGSFGLAVGFIMGLLIRHWSKEPVSNGGDLP